MLNWKKMLSNVFRLSLFIYLILFPIIGTKETFIASFQDELSEPKDASTNSWLDFPKNQNDFKSSQEFTACLWFKLKFYNFKYAACLWSYCTLEYLGDQMKCLRLCLKEVNQAANRELYMVAQVPCKNGGRDTSARLFGYNHRAWGHVCWSFSAVNGKSRFYYNGILLKEETLNLDGIDYGFQGSELFHDVAFIFGQEPDSMRGKFDSNEAFLGELSELNLWNYELDMSNIENLAMCNVDLKGNIIGWEEKKMILHNVELTYRIDSNVLCSKFTKYVVFPQKLRYPEAREICEVHGGQLALPKSETENTNLLELIIKHKEACINDDTSDDENVAWIGAKKLNRKWYELSQHNDTTFALNYTNLLTATGTPNYDCSYIRNDGFWLGGTYACTRVSLCTVCAIRSYPVFTLKGTCSVGDIDWNYYMKLDENSQIEMYEGYKKTNIIYDNKTTTWKIEMKSGNTENFMYSLRSQKPEKAYPIGRHVWNVNDSLCNVQSQTHFIAASTCNFPLQFTCDSGHCIDISKRCNEHKDCEDRSDEKKCSLVNIPASYNKARIPETSVVNHPLQVRIHEHLINIDSIDAVHMVIVLTIELHMWWNDKRLTFSNPSKTEKNFIPHSIKHKLWTPMQNIIHENAVIGEITYDSMDDIKVIANIAEPPDTNKAIENRIFNGTFNTLELTKRARIKYNCLFNVKKFPFDHHNCSAIMKLVQSKAKMLTFAGDGHVTYDGPTNIGQFRIIVEEMKTEIANTDTYTRYIIRIPMNRIYTHQLLITFVPTFILWLFGYSTLFIDIKYSNDRFMGAGTALLVMVTLLNAITNELPETSYTKLIDYWFLWHLVSILFMIVYHVGLGRFQNHLEDPENNNQISPLPFKFMDGIRLMKMNGARKMTKINNAFITIFPLMNGIFYAIYFNRTLS